MDANQLSRFFPLTREVGIQTEEAIGQVLVSAQALAETINKVLIESPAKQEFLMSLFHLVRNVEMSLKLDGPSNVRSMLVLTKQ